MPTRKISTPKEDRQKVCVHPEHNPPSMMVFKPGTYEHICPACGKKQIFVVRGVTYEGHSFAGGKF